MSSHVAFDSGGRDDPIGAAILTADMPDQLRRALNFERVLDGHRDLEWWGPLGDPGGDPLDLEVDPDGAFVTLAGQRIPAIVDGDVVRIGIPERLGFCAAWALTACERLLKSGATSIVLTFGRGFGAAAQTWTEYQVGERSYVLDLTLAEMEFDRADYVAAIHAVIGTRIEITDQADVDRFREASRDAYPWDQDRDTFLARIAPRVRRKE
jgi:hypothetical protein